MDGDTTLEFGRNGSIIRFEPAVEFGLVPLALGIWGLFALTRSMSPESIGDMVVSLVVCFVILAFTVFGAVVLWFVVVNDVSKLTVSGTEMCLHRRLRQNHTVDLRSLDRIVTHGADPTQYVFLPKHGPPLITLNSSDWAKKMPVAVGEHFGIEVDSLGVVDKAELAAKYPNNAQSTARGYELDDDGQGRKWSW